MNQNNRHPDLSLYGRVTPDPRLARALERSYYGELSGISGYIYRSLMTERASQEISDLFEAIAMDEMEHFRVLGELILALGGNPVIRTQLRSEPLELTEDIPCRSPRVIPRILRDSIREEQEGIDEYETMMSRTQDRVVRSVLSEIIGDEQRHIAALTAALNP